MDNELKLILFLHILTAAVMAGALLGFALLVLRARDGAAGRATLDDARLLLRALVLPAAGLTGLIGLLLALRYDSKGVFQFSDQTWAHTSILLWLILTAATGYLGMLLRRSMAGSTATDGSATTRSTLFTVLLWGSVLLTLVILYLMVFQPGR
jgi:uncharacterized membrane protein